MSPSGGRGGVPPGHAVDGPRPDQEADGLLDGRAEAGVAGQGVGLAEGQGRHRVAVHPHGQARPPQVAVGLLRFQEELQPLADHRGVFAVEVGVARPEVGQQREAGQRGVGLTVVALAEADFAGRAVDGERVVVGGGAAVAEPGGPAVPPAVGGVLVPGEPVERPLDRLLAGHAGAGPLGQGRPVGVEPGAVDRRDVRQRATQGRLGRAGAPASPEGVTLASAAGVARSASRLGAGGAGVAEISRAGLGARRTAGAGEASAAEGRTTGEGATAGPGSRSSAAVVGPSGCGDTVEGGIRAWKATRGAAGSTRGGSGRLGDGRPARPGSSRSGPGLGATGSGRVRAGEGGGTSSVPAGAATSTGAATSEGSASATPGGGSGARAGGDSTGGTTVGLDARISGATDGVVIGSGSFLARLGVAARTVGATSRPGSAATEGPRSRSQSATGRFGRPSGPVVARSATQGVTRTGRSALGVLVASSRRALRNSGELLP